MRVIQTVPLAVLPLLVSLVGCNKIMGIEEKQYASGGAGGQGGEGGGGTTSETCGLTDPNDAAVRIMNALPGKITVDLCAKPTTSSSFGEPWFKSGGASCGSGVAYTQYTADLGIATGKYDFKIVSAGSKCTASGIELGGIELGKGDSFTLVAHGLDLDQGSLSALKNRKPDGLTSPLRFVHALNTPSRLTAGIAKSTVLPTTFVSPIFLDVEKGGVAAPSAGGPTSVDDVVEGGYTLYAGSESTRAPVSLGVAYGNQTDVAFAAPLSVTSGHAYSIFAIGVEGNIEQRPRIWTCDETESEGLFLNCGNPVDVSFEVFNPNLADAFTSSVVERMLPATRAIVAEDVDVLCVTELFDPKVKTQLKELASTQFKYRAFSDDVPKERQVPMPPRQDGSAPAYSPIACPAGVDTLLDAFLQCGMNAAESPGSPCTTADTNGDHFLSHPGDLATNCFSANCSEQGYALMTADASGIGVVCYMCGLTHLASYESFEATKKACTQITDKPEHLAFGGTSGLAVFSTYPLGEPEVVLLPSTGWQRAAMRVPVQLPNGTVVDHWCGAVRFPNVEIELPYAGQYGGDGYASGRGAVVEQQYQIQTLINAVKKRRNSTGSDAVVGVVTFTGPELQDAKGNILVRAQEPNSYALLDNVWPRLVASSYVPLCTYCGDSAVNPLNTAGPNASFWSTHLFAEGITPAQVQSTNRTFDNSQPVTLSLATGTLKAPISQHFGLRSVVTVTQ